MGLVGLLSGVAHWYVFFESMSVVKGVGMILFWSE